MPQRFQVLNLIAFLALLLFLWKFSSYLLGDNMDASEIDKARSSHEEEYESFPRISTEKHDIPRGKLFKFYTETGDKLSYKEGLVLLEKSRDFRDLVNSTLLSPQYPALFWEFPPISQFSSPSFEFVVKKAPALSGVSTDHHAFQEHFSEECQVAAFPNLGRDAQLVAPCPTSPDTDYTHLASFLRSGEEDQIHTFLKRAGVEMGRLLSTSKQTVWMSTSGLGIYYLHLRLDSYPKYYTHMPYKNKDYSTD